MMKSFLISLLSIAFVAGCSGQKSRSNQAPGRTAEKNQANHQTQGQMNRHSIDSQAEARAAAIAAALDKTVPPSDKAAATDSAASPSKGSDGAVDAAAIAGSLPPPATVSATTPAQNPTSSTNNADTKPTSTATANSAAPAAQANAAPAAATAQAEVKEQSAPSATETAAKAQADAQGEQTSAQAAKTNEGEKTFGPEYLNYVEWYTATTFLKEMFKEGYNAVRAQLGTDGLTLEIKAEAPQVKMRLLHEGRAIMEINDFATNMKDQMVNNTNNGYNYAVFCFMPDCELLFVAINKFSADQKNLELNYTKVLKKVDGQYIISKEKTSDEYAKEYESFKTNKKKKKNMYEGEAQK